MLDININWNLNAKLKGQLELIESLSNAKGDINIEWDIDEETLNNIILQLTLIEKSKELWLEYNWNWTQLWIKRKVDNKFIYQDLKGKDWIDGNKWDNWKDWVKWSDWKDGITWIDGIDWVDWIDWFDWVDWISWSWLEFDWKDTDLWVKKVWDRDFEYRSLKWPRWVRGFSWDDFNRTSFTYTAWTHTLNTAYGTIYCDTSAWQVNLNLPETWINKDIAYYIKKTTADSNLVSIIPQSGLIEWETTVELDDNTWILFSNDWTNWFALTY
jgi:hypothetical protein